MQQQKKKKCKLQQNRNSVVLSIDKSLLTWIVLSIASVHVNVNVNKMGSAGVCHI